MTNQRLEEIRKRVDYCAGVIGPVIDQEDADYILHLLDAQTKRLEAVEAALDTALSLAGPGSVRLEKLLNEQMARWQKAKAEAEKAVNDARS